MSKKKNQNNSDSFERGIEKIVDPLIEGIGKVYDGIQSLRKSELDDKKQVYQHIADFLKQKFQKDDFTCLTATYILFADEQDKQLVESAKKILLGVKVHYEGDRGTGIYKRTTEIFFSNNVGEDNFSIKRIENQIQWDNIDSNIREFFLRERKNKITLNIYP